MPCRPFNEVINQLVFDWTSKSFQAVPSHASGVVESRFPGIYSSRPNLLASVVSCHILVASELFLVNKVAKDSG